jgi:hypothetical protein
MKNQRCRVSEEVTTSAWKCFNKSQWSVCCVCRDVLTRSRRVQCQRRFETDPLFQNTSVIN